MFSTARARTWAWLPSLVVSLAALVLLALLLPGGSPPLASAAAPAKTAKDPAAWGSDHVGQGVPQNMESGECLFCHRMQVGVTWATNKHNRTIREPEPKEPSLAALRANEATKSLADEVQLILGDTRAQRFLKRSAAYGKLDMLSTVAQFGRGARARLTGEDQPHWQEDKFAKACAGCHATAVDPESHAFSTVSLDCFSCHGDATEEHANDATLMPLAKARHDSPEAITSICASCHVRFGKSKASGLPYPTNFVAGDNLFKDFEVDWSKADDPQVNPGDRHVLDNIREVVLYGGTTTCLSCHDVHTGSSKKHRELAVVESCQLCHEPGSPIKGHKSYEVHSERCEY